MKSVPFVPGNIYHIYNHGVGSENLFRKEDNYRYFLQKYAFHVEPIAETFAYCLLPNHFHFLIRIREQTLESLQISPKPVKKPALRLSQKLVSKAFGNFFSAYTQAYNKMYNRKGGLFQSRLQRRHVSGISYYKRLIHYIHYNPVKHGLVDIPEDWRYSSYGALISDKRSQIPRSQIYSWFGSKTHFIDSHTRSSAKF